jgi:calcium-dependent protein kinase
LSGTLPFNSLTMTDIFMKTLNSDYSFKGKSWNRISQKAKDLIDEFLKTDPEQRISLEDALKHPWFKEVKQKQKNVKKIALDRQLTENMAIESTR